MNRTQLLFCLFLSLLAAGCSDDYANGPDARKVLDAGPPDALRPDATPADAAPPPSDAEACRYLPETTETTMPNYPIRFADGQGLEESPDLRQTGLLELENAHLGNRNVIELRRGAVQLGDSRSTTPGDVVPDADRRAIWARGNEVLLETQDSIYKQQRAVTSFTWLRAAAWTRMRLREFFANTFASDVLSADYAVLGDATLVAYQLSGGTAQLAIYGPQMALEVSQSYTVSERPRLVHRGDEVFLWYRNTATNTLFRGSFDPGDTGITTLSSGIPCAAGASWDVHGLKLDTGNKVQVIAAEDGVNNVFVSINADTVNTTHTVITGFASVNDVAVSIWPLVRSGNIRYAVAYIGNTGVIDRSVVNVYEVPAAGGAVSLVSTTATNLAATTRAVAVSWESVDKFWVANEEDSAGTRRVVYGRGDATVPVGFTTAGATHETTALVTQGAIAAGTPSNTSGPANPLSPAFGEMLLSSDMVQRSGWVVFAPRTSEVVSRSFVGFTGNLTTRTARPPKGSMIAEGQGITWAGPASIPSSPASTTLRTIALCKLDRTARANKPAFLDGTSVGAHAGYPRAYDGTRAFEHDWHSLPYVGSISNGNAGTTTAGEHFYAVTFEADDANGLRYRSAPYFFVGGIVSAGGAASSPGVAVEAMSHTERSAVRAVVWMTRVGLPDYRRAAEAAVTGAAQTIIVSVTDAVLATREQLDQGPLPSAQGIAPSVPARVTDFVSLLIDRLASRDPREASLLTFTTPSREAVGFSAQWYDDGVLQEPLERDITSAVEINGRVVVGSEFGLAQLIQDGPDATGEGSFGLPLALLAPIGIEDHASTERLPMGYGFSTADGPRILTPNLTVAHVDEQVERHYTIDGGHVVAIAWDALREEIVWLDDTEATLRLNPHNNRWSSDSNRTGRDLTVTDDGTVYVLRSDGKVLQQSGSVFADGATAYALKVATPHVREPARDGQAHGGFNFAGVEVFGEYVGPHALTVTVYLDFRDTPVIFQGTIAQADIVANAAAGRDYRYVLYTESRHCYACKVVVETSAVANETVRIAGIDIRYNPDGSADPAQVAEEQRVPLTVSFLA